MVERRTVYIEGSQHYNDELAALACAAAPVCSPAGSALGSVSLGGPIEVANPIDTLTALVPATVIQRRHLPAHLRQVRRSLNPLERAERDAIVNALEATGGNKSEAAATLGIGRTTLYRRLRQLGLDGDESSL